MITHIHPETGMPIFVLDQIVMVKELKAVYDKYGIHGINYCFLFGWAGSPFATITDVIERHKLVYKQVYSSTYYDNVMQEEVKPNQVNLSKQTNQYEQVEIVAACEMIKKLARVIVLEDKVSNYIIRDNIRKNLEDATKKLTKDSVTQEKILLTNDGMVAKKIDAIILREREILAKTDYKASLSDFFSELGI